MSFPKSIECPYCNMEVEAVPLWQGIHVCVKSSCDNCGVTLVSDLKIGQAIYSPYTVCLERREVLGEGNRPNSISWFGKPLLTSLLKPDNKKIEIHIDKRIDCDEVVILNCMDYLYGHSLLKLLNAERHLDDGSDTGLVVIVPEFLRWMVPEGVAEVWVVDLKLDEMRAYYPDLDKKIQRECDRFTSVKVSRAYSHPVNVDISRFTGVSRHDFSRKNPRLTFIWRGDRLWNGFNIIGILARRGIPGFLFLWWQRRKIISLFKRLKRNLPDVKFTVAGIGREGKFPDWIDDQRLDPPLSKEQERALCRVYAESRMVVGVHGSNMLLPTAHAGMVVDLMPRDRWGNLAQDNLMQDSNLQMLQYRSVFLPNTIPVNELAQIISCLFKSVLLVMQNFYVCEYGDVVSRAPKLIRESGA